MIDIFSRKGILMKKVSGYNKFKGSALYLLTYLGHLQASQR